MSRVSIFGKRKVGDASDMGNPNYWTPSRYLAKLHRVVYRESTNPSTPNASFYIIESMVVGLESEVTDPDIHAEYGKPKRPGELVSHVIQLNKLPDLALAAVKNFAVMLLNTPEALSALDDDARDDLDAEIAAVEAGDEYADPATVISEIAPGGDGQTFAGVHYIVNAIASRKRNNDPFTRVGYFAAEMLDTGEDDEDEDEDEATEPEPPRRKRRRNRK